MRTSNETSDNDGKCLTSDIQIDELFDSNRLLGKNDIFKIILYFPFGLLLLFVRLTTGIFGLLILRLLPRTSFTRSIIFQGICRVLGLVVQIDDKYFDGSAKLLVANHVSILDRIAVNVLVPCYTITQKFHVTDVLSFWKDTDDKHHKVLTDDDILHLQKHIEGSSLPILNFPENAMSNGKVGLMKFHPAVFSLNLAVQPVLVHVSLSSFIKVSPSVLGSNVWSDILWSFFLPCTLFTLKVLPSVVKSADESAWDFSKRVQQTMATAMSLIPTVYTCADKAELVKKLKASVTGIPNSSSCNSPASVSGHSHAMLPSKNPESQQLKAKLTFNTAAKKFGKSPKERMMSYQERKAILMEAARMKYLEKHDIL